MIISPKTLPLGMTTFSPSGLEISVVNRSSPITVPIWSLMRTKSPAR